MLVCGLRLAVRLLHPSSGPADRVRSFRSGLACLVNGMIGDGILEVPVGLVVRVFSCLARN